MKATWKKGYRAKTDASTCFEELERIREKHGSLDKQTVKALARDENNPLHHEIFDCAPGEASERYYLERTARLIASIEVVRKELPMRPTRAYEITTEVLKNNGPTRVYKTTEEILADPVSRSELLGDAIRDLHRLKKRYYMLSELSKVFAVADEAFLKTGD